MTFRPQSGPPASSRQVQQLATLLGDAGYADFRSARGPLGLTQRQGLGKFTSAEADVLIEQLEREAEAPTQDDAVPTTPVTVTSGPLEDTPTDVLLAELRRRGWVATKA